VYLVKSNSIADGVGPLPWPVRVSHRTASETNTRRARYADRNFCVRHARRSLSVVHEEIAGEGASMTGSGFEVRRTYPEMCYGRYAPWIGIAGSLAARKIFEVDVNYDVIAFGDIPLRLGHRLVGRASRAKAVAVLGERRIPALLQNLQQRLLDQSVDDARDAEFPNPAVRFGYFDPFGRLRLVGSNKQLGSYVWPMLK
jgi:hypothetical protein